MIISLYIVLYIIINDYIMISQIKGSIIMNKENRSTNISKNRIIIRKQQNSGLVHKGTNGKQRTLWIRGFVHKHG